MSSIIKTLHSAYPFRSVLHADVRQMEGAESYYFSLSIDPGIAPDESFGWPPSALESIMSRQYPTYDRAVEALNDRLAAFYQPGAREDYS